MRLIQIVIIAFILAMFISLLVTVMEAANKFNKPVETTKITAVKCTILTKVGDEVTFECEGLREIR